MRFVDQSATINPLNAELNSICHLLALLGIYHIFHVSRIRVKLVCLLYALFWVNFRRLNFICRRFGTFSLSHLYRRIGVEWLFLRNVGVFIWKKGLDQAKSFFLMSTPTFQIKHQPDATIFQFIILTFIHSSTCFERCPAHHQDLNDCSGSLWFYFRIVVTVVLCSWSGRPVGFSNARVIQSNTSFYYC
jgi:hypothetical protein